MSIEIKQPPTIAEQQARVVAAYAREAIFQEINRERHHQDLKWGGASHDDNEETVLSFMSYIVEYATASSERTSRHDVRTRAIKVAALAVALVEKLDRAAASGGGQGGRADGE